MSTDPAAGFDFYSALFGWTKSTAVDMGEMGTYQLFAWRGTDIGGMMGLGNAPQSCWLPYFRRERVEAAMTRIADAGGTVLHGPIEVPGGAYIAVARDPQMAHFAIVGPLDPRADRQARGAGPLGRWPAFRYPRCNSRGDGMAMERTPTRKPPRRGSR